MRDLGPVPPDDGFDGDEWVPGHPDRVTGEVIGKVAVPLPADAHAIVVGPDEVLVVATPHMATAQEMDMHREQFRVALGSDRFIILFGRWQLSKVAAAESRKALEE